MTKSTNQHKYESFNPLRSMFLAPFQRRFIGALAATQPTGILEVGAGEGFLLSRIHGHLPQVPLLGLDVESRFIDEGRRIFPELDLRVGDVYHLQQPDRSWDTVIASEVLEHLDRPADGLRELARVAQRQVILSVPWEPWFRGLNFARGKHLRRWGNHPEHVNNWTQRQFVHLVGTALTVERVIPSLPWTIVVAKV